MNSIILYATAILLKVKPKLISIIISSAVGSIYAIITYMIQLPLYTSIIAKIILAVVMVYIGFNPQSTKKMWKQVLIFYLTSFVFGGVSLYLIYFIRPQEALIKNGMFVGTYVLKTIFLGAILGTVIIIIAFKISKNKMTKKDILCQTKIKLEGKEITLNTMLDTGNMLKEPISGTPVIIVEKTSLYELMPKEILEHTEEILGGDFEKIPEEIKNKYISKFKMIPFSSLGKQNGMLLGIKAEKIEVLNENYKNDKKNVIIGIYNKSLTKRGEYNALIGIELY